jgi:ArsR family transcriptional regulator
MHSLPKEFVYKTLQSWPLGDIDRDRFQVNAFYVTAAEQSLNRTLHAIADPTRRRILQILKERGGCSIGKDVGLCASDIEERIRLSQPTISHHMAILKEAGLIQAQKQGQWMWYRRNEKVIGEFARVVRETL